MACLSHTQKSRAPEVQRPTNRVLRRSLPADHADQRFACRLILSKVSLFLVLVLGVRASLFAQTSSEIFGRVTDQQGLPIVEVEIVARGDTTGSGAKSITDSDGTFVVLGLQPGTYTITSARSGFTTKVYEHVDLP